MRKPCLVVVIGLAIAGCSFVKTSSNVSSTGPSRGQGAARVEGTHRAGMRTTSSGERTTSSGERTTSSGERTTSTSERTTSETTDRGALVVPELIGKTPEEASAIVAAAGFLHKLDSSRVVQCENVARLDGRIDCLNPVPGTVVTRYGSIQISVHRVQRISGAIVRSQLQALIGMTTSQAKAALASYGHAAAVTVTPASRFYERCGDDRVCAFSAAESGIDVHDPITLYINPTVTISAPPPES